ncbi:MAG: phosphatase PAP2 family protein, partial [Deltaproteobacteria bacterium]|nr:phosphatase PAP2 family protein [Deltaproteobacteria bacterium]
ADGDRLMIYAETMAIDLALMQVTKYLVQRPRPYAYNPSAAAKAYTRAAGDDARLSFYSGHAAMSFGAAVSGAYLLGASEVHPNIRMLAWGMGMATAATTANLRVRAGKHFYSDVVIGAAVGIAVGYLVPALHATDAPYSPSAGELAMGGVGLLVGMLGSELIPLGNADEHERERGTGLLGRLGIDRVGLAPMTLPSGAGLALAGSL